MTNGERFKDLFGLYATEVWAMPEKDFLEWLNTLTTTAEPIKHGQWIVNNETKEWVTIYCDQCHDGMWNRKGDPYPNYCFNCGANMRGEEND